MDLEAARRGCGNFGAKVCNVPFDGDGHFSLADEAVELCEVFAECDEVGVGGEDAYAFGDVHFDCFGGCIVAVVAGVLVVSITATMGIGSDLDREWFVYGEADSVELRSPASRHDKIVNLTT